MPTSCFGLHSRHVVFQFFICFFFISRLFSSCLSRSPCFQLLAVSGIICRSRRSATAPSALADLSAPAVPTVLLPLFCCRSYCPVVPSVLLPFPPRYSLSVLSGHLLCRSPPPLLLPEPRHAPDGPVPSLAARPGTAKQAPGSTGRQIRQTEICWGFSLRPPALP